MRNSQRQSGLEGVSHLENTDADQAALSERRNLAYHLMDAILDRDNLNQAYKQVKRNKGAAGVDGMTVGELSDWLKDHKDAFLAALAQGTYQPQAVRAVEIPKADGSKRLLGIPTVIDRLIQQAILQVLQSLYEPRFSDSSYGFRPKRSAHQAVQAGAEYVRTGRKIVVDIDLEKFFDRVDKLMGLLAKDIGDKVLLKLIRRYLETGLFKDGMPSARTEGTPQGSPLSPLLANILLNELDTELEQRGHCFCRYADDCNIYVSSQKAGERVMASISRFIEKRLKLKVNQKKSAVAPHRKFLGYQITARGTLKISANSLKRLKDKVRELTRRNRGAAFNVILKDLKNYLTGWMTYYQLSTSSWKLKALDGWIRRKVRCYRLKQTKGRKGLRRFLTQQGVSLVKAYQLASSGKGWWRLSNTPQASLAIGNQWLEDVGLVSLERRYNTLKLSRKPPDTLSMSGGVGGRQG
jgi:RNA-directed DNA polymerase